MTAITNIFWGYFYQMDCSYLFLNVKLKISLKTEVQT